MFYNCLYSLCRPCFPVSLASLVGIQQFCPLFGLHANIVEEYVVVERIVARSVFVSRVLHVFSIILCGSLFLEILFARVGVLFMYM